MELSQTACRYLLTIYELRGGLDAVRSVDVSRRLNVAASSVAHMLGILDREGMIERRRYGRVRLTPDGLRSANRLYTDRMLLETYLREHLGWTATPPGWTPTGACAASPPPPGS